MRIKQLEIHGFKSFVDRTAFRFGEGISGIVGPNGCGKSNILDAIKWVLGEQNPRSLRGQAMSDIIFSGSDRRSQVGLAEVSMTFSNSHGLFAGPYAPLSELQITRRLYRSGDSEYLINRLPARLKDIQDLFLDTGVGARAYAIIEQGRIGQIISARPEDRRRILEEAAGITRYKARREEAFRQLEQTAQNLARVSDVLAELKRQVTGLERQARRAEAYQALRLEIREADVVVGLLRLGQLLGNLERADVRGQGLVDREQVCKREVSESEEALAQLRSRLGDEGQRLSSLRERMSREQGLVQLHESSLAHHLKQEGGLKARWLDLEVEQRGLASHLEDLDQIRARGDRDLAENQARKSIVDQELATLMHRVQERSVERAGHLQKLELGRSAVIGHLTAVARLRNNLSNLERRLTELVQRMERNQDEETRIETQIRVLEETLAEHETRLDSVRRDREAAREAREVVQDEQQRLKGTLKHLEDRLRVLKEDLSHRRSRLKSLRELQQGLEGYGRGVKTLLRDYRGTGIRGTVADLLDIPAGIENAVEAVLGDRLQHLVIDSFAETTQAIAFLRAVAAGRVGFVPLDQTRPTPLPLPEDPGITGSLATLAQGTAGMETLPARLFPREYVVRSLEDAWRLHQPFPDCDFVTVEGECVSARGSVRGGSPDVGGSILSRKAEMRTLETEITRLDQQLSGTTEQWEAQRERQEALQVRQEALRETLHRLDLSLVEAEKDVKQAQSDLSRERSQLRLRALDARSLAAQQEELARESTDAAFRLGEEERARLVREDEIQDLDAQARELDRDLQHQRELMTALKVQAAELSSLGEEALRDRQRLEEDHLQTTSRLIRLQQHREDVQVELDRLISETTQVSSALDRSRAEAASIQDAIVSLSSRHGEAQRVLADREDRMAALREQYQEVSRELSAAILESSELRFQKDHLERMMDERLGGPLAALWAWMESDPLPMEVEAAALPPHTLLSFSVPDGEESVALEAAVVATVRTSLARDRLKPFAAAAAALDASLGELRARLSRLGEVNLEAVEEFRVLQERYTFTLDQEEDLKASVASIKSAITRINRTSRERFREAFDAINGHFQDIFPKMFQGGAGRLVLTDEEDLLETGVDIVVQPPGKRVQNMNLLSGGEKAMAAVALIFAIFRVRPSPFCILDEVDAPLDEANTGRFQEVVRELSELSQFIVITHNKKTMQIADTLYGVTMEEPGVSRLVTVDLT